MDRNEILERERRWGTPVALVTLLAVVLFSVQAVLLTIAVGNGGQAEVLRKANDHLNTILVAWVLQGIALGLLAAPLVYLFRAAQARNPGMRGQLIGLVVVAPLFMAVSSVIYGASVLHNAAPDFVSMMVQKHATGTGDHANSVAQDVITNQSLGGLAAGLGLAGALGFGVAMAYSCYQAMKVGLLTRLWGSVGLALGVASAIPGGPFLQFTFVWFVYLAIQIAVLRPRGNPLAWATGEAMSWPTPGEKAAQSLGPGNEPGGAGEGNGADAAGNPPRERGERRKRKRRQQ